MRLLSTTRPSNGGGCGPQRSFWALLLLACVGINLALPWTKSLDDLIKRRQKRHLSIGCPRGTILRSTGMRAFLTVSSLASTSSTGVITQRQLQLNWYNDVVQSGDWVGLFDHDPITNPVDPLQRVNAIDYPAGTFRTDTQFPRTDLTSPAMRRTCLGYWVGYVRAGATIASDCIKIEPTWMNDFQSDLSPLMYRDLMIPGSHDTGSFAEYKGRESDNIFTRWVITQEENTWEQLVYGIRSFDLRIGYYNDTTEKFWLNHNYARVRPLHQTVSDVQRFLNQTQEIVLLDFHRFPVGFTNHPARHLELAQYLEQELGQYMLSPSVGYDVTMETMWRSGKRLIVAYSDSATAAANDLLWSGIPQIWANTMDPVYLRDYLQGYMESGRTDIWSAQAELTPTTSDVLFTDSSLRVLADEINLNVTQWARDLWWNEASVITVDFLLGSNLINVAIEANLKRRMCYDFARQRAQTSAQQRDNRYAVRPAPPTHVGPRSSSSPVETYSNDE